MYPQVERLDMIGSIYPSALLFFHLIPGVQMLSTRLRLLAWMNPLGTATALRWISVYLRIHFEARSSDKIKRPADCLWMFKWFETTAEINKCRRPLFSPPSKRARRLYGRSSALTSLTWSTFITTSCKCALIWWLSLQPEGLIMWNESVDDEVTSTSPSLAAKEINVYVIKLTLWFFPDNSLVIMTYIRYKGSEWETAATERKTSDSDVP